MKRCLLLLGAAACVTGSESYPVAAVAELEGAGITGPLEVLGADSDPSATTVYIDRTVAAYRVQLPDTAPRRVMIYDDRSCDAPRDSLMLRTDLREIRRVGDEAHFFASVDLHGRQYDVDTNTIYAPISMVEGADNYVVGKIAVLRTADAEDGSPGEWLACGVFVRNDIRTSER